MKILKNKKITFLFAAFAIGLLFAGAGYSAFAHTGTGPQFATPLIHEGEGPLRLCDFWHVSNHIINFLLFVLATPILIIMLLAGGIIWLTSAGNPGQIERGKKLIVSAIIGVLIAFSGWLIIGTIINTLANEGFSGAWNAIQCPTGGASTKPSTETDTAETGTETGTSATLTHSEALNQLASGITVTSTGNCSDRNNSNCTSLEGIKQTTITGINNFKQECDCNVNISGGTEVGHSTNGNCTHEKGCKLDISITNTKLNNYVQNTYEPIGKCFAAASACYRSPTGQIWAREDLGPRPHWDIAFK